MPLCSSLVEKLLTHQYERHNIVVNSAILSWHDMVVNSAILPWHDMVVNSAILSWHDMVVNCAILSYLGNNVDPKRRVSNCFGGTLTVTCH